jgi:hypothetical protein
MPTLREIKDEVNNNRETEKALQFLEMEGVKEALLEAAGRGDDNVSIEGWRGLQPCSTFVVHPELGKVYINFCLHFDDESEPYEFVYVAW